MHELDGWGPDDDFFGRAVIDRDERRDAPAPHRYLHGGFEGTDTRFVLCLPDEWEGRLVQFLQGGMGGNEHQGTLVQGREVAFSVGGAFVDSNQGHVGNDLSGLRGDQSILQYRASRATALYARHVVEQVYGTPAHHSYLFGGSGGGLRGIDCAERCPDVWDGVVPFIINRNGLVTWNWSVLAWATMILGDGVTDVVDATDAGGTGDPFATLDDEQRAALATLYRAGYCRGAESQITPSPLWILGLQLLRASDPQFFEDFWKVPGHAGHDGSPIIDRVRRRGTARVAAVRTAGALASELTGADDLFVNVIGRAPAELPLGIVLDDIEGAEHPGQLLGAELTFTSGARDHQSLLCTGAIGDAATAILDPVGMKDVRPGDQLRFDNAELIAFAHHHRHSCSLSYPEMAQLFVDGTPLHPQRPRSIDRMPVPSGRFEQKMILIQNAADKECWPNCARAYVRSVEQHLGDAVDDRFRIWWIENAPHIVPMSGPGRTRLVNYAGAFAQAVADVVSWVEDDTPPPASTSYGFGPDNDLRLPSDAAERRGVQPVVTCTANGGHRAEVEVGDEVRLVADIAVPPGAGRIVEVAWDLDGSGDFTLEERLDPAAECRVESTCTFDEPGTHFVTVRVASHRDGDADDRLRRVHNLARARVVVA